MLCLQMLCADPEDSLMDVTTVPDQESNIEGPVTDTAQSLPPIFPWKDNNFNNSNNMTNAPTGNVEV